ncbi:asialoglycoprotein receptor 2-like [Labrus mixtus]|uniref:asialoglycoprotein receptor 2-like n=1 Tax=Labrus mixtus TaxID=508554 RepID=UPI0029C0D3C9|nr:asialoglycoprotein receptor 2-like [Labrus mixtus]
MEGTTCLFLLLSGLCFLPVCFPRRYILVREALTWTEAQRYCREKFTDLASVSSQQESDQLREATEELDVGHLWIGLYDDIDSWRWSLEEEGYYGEGEAEFRKWHSKAYNNIRGTQTCVLISQYGTWNDFICTASYQFVCYDDSSSSFILVNETKTWTEAQRYCRERYTDLASVRNQSENDQIKGLLKNSNTWIGLHRDSWGWSDGSPYSLRKWATNRPRSGFGTPCALLHRGLWEDMNCDTERYFVCQDLVKKRVLRVQVTRKDSTVNLEEAAAALLWQLRERLKELSLREDVKLTWRKQPDGKIFNLEKREKKKKKKKKKKKEEE